MVPQMNNFLVQRMVADRACQVGYVFLLNMTKMTKTVSHTYKSTNSLSHTESNLFGLLLLSRFHTIKKRDEIKYIYLIQSSNDTLHVIWFYPVGTVQTILLLWSL